MEILFGNRSSVRKGVLPFIRIISLLSLVCAAPPPPPLLPQPGSRPWPLLGPTTASAPCLHDRWGGRFRLFPRRPTRVVGGGCGGWQDAPVPMWRYRIDRTYPPWSGDRAELQLLGLQLFIVYLFASMLTDLPLSPTGLVPSLLLSSLLFYYQIFLWFSKNILHLLSTNDRPLINPQWPWSYTVDCLLICIADPRYISLTDPVPGLLLSSLVLWYQILLWFYKISLHLQSKIDKPLIDTQWPWYSVVYCWLNTQRLYEEYTILCFEFDLCSFQHRQDVPFWGLHISTLWIFSYILDHSRPVILARRAIIM